MNLYQHSFSSMGCPCHFELYCESENHFMEVKGALLKEVNRLDQYYTNYSEDSFTAEINRSSGNKSGIIVDQETAGLLDYAHACYQQSEGLFDLTTGILKQAWNISSPSFKLPSQSFLQSLLEKVGWEKVIWTNPKLILPIKGMTLDFGGIVKEYAADAAASICRQKGIIGGFVSLGGDITVIGPHPDGRPWCLGIKGSRNEQEEIATVFISQGGLATSGDYERYIDIKGKRYNHIINPETGWPVEGLSSVSVVANHCLIAGSFATIGLLKKPEKATKMLHQTGLSYLCIEQQGKVISNNSFILR